MKKLLAFAVAAAVLIGTASVYAGGSCCMAGKTGASGGASCGGMFSKLNLTDAQKAKIDALKDRASRAPSTSESHAIFNDGIAQILTADQLAQWKAQCDKVQSEKPKGSGQCPFMKGQQKS